MKIDIQELYQEYKRTGKCPLCGNDEMYIRLNRNALERKIWWQFNCRNNRCQGRWHTPKQRWKE